MMLKPTNNMKKPPFYHKEKTSPTIYNYLCDANKQNLLTFPKSRVNPTPLITLLISIKNDYSFKKDIDY